jgi:hypothetical protein
VDEIQWELAGLSDDGMGLTRPVRTSDWRVPARVDLYGDGLLWHYIDGPRIGKIIHARRGLVDAFVKLADANPEGIRDFARRWGVLMICEHGKPAGHSFPRELLTDALNGPEKSGWCTPRGWPDECWEPLGAWYMLAREARAMLNVAAALHTQQPAKRGDWHMLVYRTWCGPEGGDPTLDMLNQPRYAAGARAWVEDSVNRWVAWAAVQPRLIWSGRSSPTIDFEGCGLFGALAAQILAAVNTGGWMFCSGCGKSYDPGPRRPNPKRRSYCPACREHGVPHRDAMRDLRRRQDPRENKEHRR